MSTPVPNPIPIFRIMHIRNLESVVASGYIFCESQRQQLNGPWQSIAHENIQFRRRAKVVPCGPKGVVCDYVPWYYAPRSPMLYANHKGNVLSNPEGQKAIIYFKTTVQKVLQAGLSFVFTDGHDHVQFPFLQRYWRFKTYRLGADEIPILVHYRCRSGASETSPS